MVVWLRRFLLRSLAAGSENQGKVGVSGMSFLVVVKCDNCTGSVMIVEA
jgi:hypothetical protein